MKSTTVIIIVTITILITYLVLSNIDLHAPIKERWYVNGRKEVEASSKYEHDKYVTSKEGTVKKVDIFTDYVIAYMPESKINEVLEFQKSAKEKKLDIVLNPILEHGKTYIKYPRCYHILDSKQTIPNLAEDLDMLEKTIDIGFFDFKIDNVMLCGEHLKITDQDNPHTSLFGINLHSRDSEKADGRIWFEQFKKAIYDHYQSDGQKQPNQLH